MRGIKPNGPRIFQLRRDSGATQEQIATLAQCDVKTLRKAEKGSERIDLSVAMAIAKALNVDFQDLVCVEDLEDVGAVATPERLIELTRQWNQTFLDQDYDSFLAMHTDDTVVELPGVDSLPHQEHCHGIDQLREFVKETSQELRLTSYDPESLQIYVFGNIVFMRARATIEHIPSGRTYTTVHVNELEFQGEKIARRLTVADYDLLRRIYSDQTT